MIRCRIVDSGATPKYPLKGLPMLEMRYSVKRASEVDPEQTVGIEYTNMWDARLECRRLNDEWLASVRERAVRLVAEIDTYLAWPER